MEADERRIRELHAAWIAAVNDGDLDCLLASMTEDAVFLNPGQAPLRRDGLAANFAEAHRQWSIRCRSDLVEVVVGGALAFARSRDALTVCSRSDGQTAHLAGNRLTVYRRQPDGCWRLARDAHTLSPSAAPDSRDADGVPDDGGRPAGKPGGRV
jgi:uncharacterized protein (TIGR02246 family)